MLVIVRVLMINLRLLILDEVMEGLVFFIRMEIWGVFQYLKSVG